MARRLKNYSVTKFSNGLKSFWAFLVNNKSLILIAFLLALIVITATNKRAKFLIENPIANRVFYAFEVIYSPVDVVVSKVKGSIAKLESLFSEYDSSRALKQENKKLHKKIAILESKLNDAQAIKNLGKLKGRKHKELIARVVGSINSPYNDHIIINVGAKEGVHVGNAVATTSGLIGRVISTTNHYSRVMVVTDISSKIPVVITSTGQKCIAAGTGTNSLKLLYLPENHHIKDSSYALTSADAGIMPHGIYVGKIIRKENGLMIDTDIDWSTTNVVRVYLTDPQN